MRCFRLHKCTQTAQPDSYNDTTKARFAVFPGRNTLNISIQRWNATVLLHEHNGKKLCNALSKCILSHIHCWHMCDVHVNYSHLSLLPSQPLVGWSPTWAWSRSRFLPFKREVFLASVTCNSGIRHFIWYRLNWPCFGIHCLKTLMWPLKINPHSYQARLLFWPHTSHLIHTWSPSSLYPQQYITGNQIWK